MEFLRQFLNYSNICIQCHNNPDADTLASALGLYCYFSDNGIETSIIYGGTGPIKKRNLKYMIEMCDIPVKYVKELPDTELLLIVDGQYGQGNVQRFEASEIAVIDHHMKVMIENDKTFINNSYQSCSTIIYELLKQEKYNILDRENLCVAFLYGLYTDTASYSDLYRENDINMREELKGDYPVLERLKKSCLTVAELMVAGDALHNFYFDAERKYILIPAIHCEPAVLGIIGDMAIQVDSAKLSLAYADSDNGYQISIRSCDREYPANKVAELLCRDIGNGGGHIDKAGGKVFSDKIKKIYENMDITDVFMERMNTIIAGE